MATKEEKNTDLNSNGGKFPSIIQGFGYKILQFRLRTIDKPPSRRPFNDIQNIQKEQLIHIQYTCDSYISLTYFMVF